MVTYASPYLSLRAVGYFGTAAPGQDIWACGWKFPLAASFSISAASVLAFLDTVDAPVSTFHTNTSLKSGASCFLRALQGALVGTDGKYLGTSQETVELAYPTPVAGNTTTSHPYSTATTLTHFTQFPRGKASRGRVFWPATGQTLDTSFGGIPSPFPAQIATAYKTLVDSMNQAAAAIFEGDVEPLAVVGQDTALSPGRVGTVLRVGVGRSFDTQRRRDNKITEAHSLATLATPPGLLEQLVGAPYTEQHLLR